MIKLVAFDWNGTLFDDAHLAWAADNFILKKLNFKPITFKKFQESFDIPIIKYWRNVGFSKKFLKINLEKLEAGFREDYEKNESSGKLRPNTKTMLASVQKAKIESIIYSNHTAPHIKKQLVRLNIQKYFKTILARDLGDVAHLLERGKEQKLRDYIKTKGYKPNEIISVGDTEEEIEIGKANGFHTIAIKNGFNTLARLKKHKPDFIISNMLELKKIINKLNS